MIQNDKTSSYGDLAFFFGCRKQSQDFHYGPEWESYCSNGTLSIFEVAFSRDQPQKVYVQHKITERSKEVWQMLEKGGYIFVSGSASQMPNDVRKAIQNIVSKESGVDLDQAENYLKRLELLGRYATETWQ